MNKESTQQCIRFILAVAGLGGLLYGIDFGIIATASPYIKSLGLFSDAQLSWIVGAVLFGGIVSSLTAGMLTERFGRKKMIVASSVLFLVAVPLVCLSDGSPAMMLSARTLQGMSAGYMSVVMPMYLTEILPPEIRGRGTGVFQFFLILGLVAAALVGLAVAKTLGAADAPADLVSDAAKSLAWKINFWWTLLPVALLFAGSLKLPESPVWLRGKREKGRGKREDHSAVPHSPFPVPLTSRRYVVPFLLALAVLTLNKTTGMSSVTSYSVMILQKAGLAGAMANGGDVAMKLANMAATLAATCLVDRIGRRCLLKIGTAGMTLGLAAIGGVMLAIERVGVESSPLTGFVCLAAFVVMQLFYALGPGTPSWECSRPSPACWASSPTR